MIAFFLFGVFPAICFSQWKQGTPIFCQPDYYKWSDGTYRTKRPPQQEITQEDLKALLKDKYHDYF